MQTQEITVDWLKENLVKSLKLLYKKEQRLLDDKLCERAVLFRLGVIMLPRFKPAEVYIEYNKKHDPNGEALAKSLGDSQATSYPDILVFTFNDMDVTKNKLIIEAKMAYQRNAREDILRDVKKLKYFTNPQKEYKYLLGMHLIMDKKNFMLCEYFDSEVVSIQKYSKRNNRWCQSTISPNEYEAILGIGTRDYNN